MLSVQRSIQSQNRLVTIDTMGATIDAKRNRYLRQRENREKSVTENKIKTKQKIKKNPSKNPKFDPIEDSKSPRQRRQKLDRV